MMNSLSVCFCSTLWSKNSSGLTEKDVAVDVQDSDTKAIELKLIQVKKTRSRRESEIVAELLVANEALVR